MKSVINRIIGTFLLVTLTGSAVFARTVRRVSFSSDIKVNGTLVEKGQYDVTFDEKTGELLVQKHGKVVIKTSARLEKRDRKAAVSEVHTTLEGVDQRLVAITFSGTDQNVVVNRGNMQASGN